MSFEWLNAQSPTIIYIGDPLCSWCYAFAPEISEVKEALPNYDFKLVWGGLRPGGTETNADLGDFLDHHWKEIEQRTGVPFNYDRLKDESLVYDTEPACRAVVVARSMKPEIELDFFEDVQKLFYVESVDILSVDSYAELAKKYNLDEGEYRTRFLSEEMKIATANDFRLSSEMGVKGFPSVILKTDKGQFYMVSNGYTTSEKFLSTIKKAVQKQKDFLNHKFGD